MLSPAGRPAFGVGSTYVAAQSKTLFCEYFVKPITADHANGIPNRQSKRAVFPDVASGGLGDVGTAKDVGTAYAEQGDVGTAKDVGTAYAEQGAAAGNMA
jgi:hypothetical protein